MYGKQMEMFEDGGLNQEGGMIDPVSGNDVPVGSTRAEVRDDIPAMLSEGEFVFPADVVRYFGLERLMEMRQQAKMGLQKMEAMGQMGNSEEATIPDDLPFSPDDLILITEPEGYAAGGYIKAQQGTFVPNPMTGVAGYQPSMFNDGSMNIAPATTGPASSMVPTNAAGTPTGYLPSFVGTAPAPAMTGTQQGATGAAGTTTTTTTAQPTTPPAETPFVPEVGNVYTFKKYINPTTGEIRDFPFYFNDPVIPIPDGFIPYTPETQPEQEVTDVGVQTTQMLQDEGDDDGFSDMPQPEPVDYSKMNADEIMQAYKNNQTASAVMLGVGAAFPPVGLFGAWATNREKKKIEERMRELGLEVPEGGLLSNVVDGIKNLFGGGKEQPPARTATTGGTRAVSAEGVPVPPQRPTVAPERAPAQVTREPVPFDRQPAAPSTQVSSGRGTIQATAPTTTPVSSGRGTVQATAPVAKKDRDDRDFFSANESAAQSAQKALENTKATTQKALDNLNERGIKEGKSWSQVNKEADKVLSEAKKVESSLKNIAKGVKTGFNKGGLAARTK